MTADRSPRGRRPPKLHRGLSFLRKPRNVGVVLAAASGYALVASPAQAFDSGWGDAGKPNFIVVEWNFGTVYGEGPGSGGGLGGRITAKQVVTLSALIRANGKVICKESKDITWSPSGENSICGGTAKIEGFATGNEMKAYFRSQQGPQGWVTSPAHCGGFPHSCRHYWNWNPN